MVILNYLQDSVETAMLLANIGILHETLYYSFISDLMEGVSKETATNLFQVMLVNGIIALGV